MSDLFAGIDPNRLMLMTFIVVAVCVLLISAVMALCIHWLNCLRRVDNRARHERRDPDPFCAPGSHQGLRVGPPPARARSGRWPPKYTGKSGGEAAGPGTP